MSASPMAKAVESKSIPIKKIQIKDPSELPSSYSSTPGGTLFSTTPGGTKIVYEKTFLLNLRNSPVSRTPPSCDIPEHLMMGGPNRRHSNNKSLGLPPSHYNSHRRDSHKKSNQDQDEQFHIEL